MELGRTVLDQEVLDRNDHAMGKVDGLVLELRPGAPARVTHIVVGGTTLLWRIHPGLARWVEHRLGGEGRPARIPWSRVLRIGIDVKVDVDAERSPALHWERWVRDHLIGRIPGA
jgi:sporulation protein YlmC with PRC-barrel domain